MEGLYFTCDQQKHRSSPCNFTTTFRNAQIDYVSFALQHGHHLRQAGRSRLSCGSDPYLHAFCESIAPSGINPLQLRQSAGHICLDPSQELSQHFCS
jgi:hypothetical protein